mmetsp:Transcript_16515/g.25506  ORF Transcript_16515/g.25506 Transcript_16515/m.25506 type:complete len:87 (-) Transcript_16515:375-635(-)
MAMNDEQDDGGLDADDHVLDMAEMEHLFHAFSNAVMQPFMSAYFKGKFPLQTPRHVPYGMVETDATLAQELESEVYPHYAHTTGVK